MSDLLALASGVPLVALGGTLLWLRPRDSRHWFFGGFAILWGLQVVTANIGVVLQSGRIHHPALQASYALAVPAYLFLGYFAALFCSRRRQSLIVVPLLLISSVAGVVLALAPDLVIRVEPGENLPPTVLGPLAIPLVH